jgi:hypothetical protein
MKKTQRFVLGMISSLLLATGFVHAAGNLDPMTSLPLSSADNGSPQEARAGEDCALECDMAD